MEPAALGFHLGTRGTNLSVTSEETRCIPFPRFPKEPGKFHIRSFLLPFRFEAATSKRGGDEPLRRFAPAPLGKGSLFHASRVRRSQLHSVSAVSVRAAKTSYPLAPSSFPNGTRCAGLPFGDARNEPLSHVRRNSLHSISPVCVRAGEIPYPLLPSSFPL